MRESMVNTGFRTYLVVASYNPILKSWNKHVLLYLILAQLQAMYEKSPIFHAGKIIAPLFLMIGKNDLRVPPSQGRELFNHLTAHGKEVYMNVYDDCHPLAKPTVHSDVLVNAALFFETILKA
jgi:dipeptidyl aminopeptidase/acylaminoacyl peptidase